MNIRTAFATSPSYEGLNNASAVSFAIAPGDMFAQENIPSVYGKGKVSQLNNAFGGGAHVFSCHDDDREGGFSCKTGSGSTGTSSGSNQFFAIALTNLGREACVSLASSDWGTDGLVSIQVGDDTFTAEKLPLTMIDAGSACGGYGDRVGITWTYY